jgi:hypothetical protein
MIKVMWQDTPGWQQGSEETLPLLLLQYLPLAMSKLYQPAPKT